MDFNDRQARNLKHLADPQIGDYWHEMYIPVCVVVGRGNDSVILCTKTKEVDSEHWTWDLGHIETRPLDDFAKWLKYKSKGMGDRTWCSVVPESQKWVREAAVEVLLGVAPVVAEGDQ